MPGALRSGTLASVDRRPEPLVPQRLVTLALCVQAATADGDLARAAALGHQLQRLLVEHLRAQLGRRCEGAAAVPCHQLELVDELLTRIRILVVGAEAGSVPAGCAGMVASLADLCARGRTPSGPAPPPPLTLR